MSEDKETLKQKFFKECYDEFHSDQQALFIFDWFYTKLKNQAEEHEKSYSLLKNTYNALDSAHLVASNQIQQLKAELEKANEKITELYDANCHLSIKNELTMTQEKANAFDEAIEDCHNEILEHSPDSYLPNPVNPYRQDK